MDSSRFGICGEIEAMNTKRSHLDALLERRNLSGGERMASLNRTIDTMARKLDNIGIDCTADQKHSGSTKIDELEYRMQQLAAEIDGRGPQKITGQPRRQGRSVSNNAIAEINARKRLLNGESDAHSGTNTAHNMPTAIEARMDSQAEVLSASLADLSTRIEKFRQEMSGELSGIHTSVVNSPQAAASPDELERIANGIRELQQAPRFNPSAFDALHDDLNDLRSSLGGSVWREEFSNGIADINSRLDHISDGMNGPGTTTMLDIKDRLDAFAASSASQSTSVLMTQIDSLNDSVNSLAESKALDQLDQRLQTLVEAVDGLATSNQSAQSFEPNLVAIESRLDEITRAIVAVSVKGQNGSDSDPATFERLEHRISELGQGINLLAERDDDEQFTHLAERIENLSHQLEKVGGNIQTGGVGSALDETASTGIEIQLQELASRFDMHAAERQHEENQLAQLSDRIEGLTDRFGSLETMAQSGEPGTMMPMGMVSDTTQIEQQLKELANSIDAAASAGSADQQLQNLELQISEIAHKLNTGNPSSADFSGVENRLGQIEQHISTNQDFTLDAVSQAAQAAVAMMDKQDFPGELVSALSEDLKSLQDVAFQTESQTAETFNSVRNSLDSVANRLGSIERQLQGSTVAAADAMPHVALEPATTRVSNGINSLIGESGDSALEKIDKAPSIDPSTELDNLNQRRVEDNRPLEPGSGAPDISALVKRASEKFRKNAVSAKPTPDKTDFVAAARRAAQTAVAEVEAVQDEQADAAEKGSLLSRLSAVPRRPIIIAAAAVLLAVMAFAASRLVIGGEDRTSAVAVLPLMEGSLTSASSKSLPTQQTTVENAGKAVRIARPAISNTEPGAVESDNATAGSTPVISTDTSRTASEFVVNSIPKQTESFIPSTGANNYGAETPATLPKSGTTGETANVAASISPETMKTDKTTSAPLPLAGVGPVLLRQAAAQGDPRAQHEIGLRYTNGIGVKRNLSEAAAWYERAASQEFAPAQYRLGSLYEKGLGVKRDLINATNWYLRAAEQGNARAMHNLAVISAMGSSGKPNMSEALKWFTKAANFGVKDSQFNLGILYGQGMGVKQDLAESYKWFALAAKTGDNDSAKKRDEVANVMDPKALEKSRLAVRTWHPEKLDDSANRVVIPEEWRGKSKSASAGLGGNSAVKTTQVLLNKLGYKVGTPDGMIGPKTRRAILSFQKSTGMTQTGKIDAKLVKALKGLSI